MFRTRRRASTLVLLTIALLIASLVDVAGASARSPSDANRAHGRFIVRAHAAGDLAGVRRAASAAGAKVVEEIAATDSVVVTGSDAAESALSGDARVASVVPDRIVRVVPTEAAGTNKPHAPQGANGHDHGTKVRPDPAFSLKGLMWNVDRIHGDDAWKRTTGRPSVLVGVADTGLDFTHSELASKVVDVVDLSDHTLCPEFIAPPFNLSDADWAAEFGGPADGDWNGHGSWIGGNIAAALDGQGVNGIAPSVGLVALKISEWCGFAFDSSILAAFQYAADHGIDVVSISFGGYLDRSDPEQEAIFQAYEDVVAYARSKGTVIVAAAGNEHVRIGAEGRVISHGQLWVPGDVPDPVANPIDLFGLYENPGGVPGIVAVSATGNVVVPASKTCAPDTIGSATDTSATCKPKSDAHQAAGQGRENQLAYYSNFGPRIDIAAPGGARKFNVPVWDRGGTPGFPYTDADGYTAYEAFSITSNWALEIPCFFDLGPQFYPGECYSTIQGTSMATPHVSAVAALIISAHPWMAGHVGQIVRQLKETASDIHGNTTQPVSATDTSAGDLSGIACPTGYCHLGGRSISDDDAYGAGLVDAGAAVR